MGGKRTGGVPSVFQLLEQAPRGKTLYLPEIEEMLLDRGVNLTTGQVQSALYHVAKRKDDKPFRVQIVVSGRAWRVFDVDAPASPAQAARQQMRRDAAAERDAGPDVPAVGDVLEVLAVTRSGVLLVQDEHGETWKATRV